MTLDEWRKHKGLSCQALGAQLGVQGANVSRTVQRWTTYQRVPSNAMLRRIEELTGGLVSRDDFPDHPVVRAAPAALSRKAA